MPNEFIYNSNGGAMSVKLVNDATALLSMRESDFNATSAYGEVIDNSIEANAENIKIYFEYEQGTQQEAINWVAFGDDGSGMSPDLLHHCLQLGYSSRYNKRDGIGRFGVGATLAAINQCQRVEIFSKESNSNWYFTYIDLEQIMNDPTKATSIAEPTLKDPTSSLLSLSDENHGTIVLWKKYDRQPHKATRVIEDAKEWIGRTYRYFIWEDIKITLNNQIVPAVDPLYARTEKTKFPEDPKAELFPVDKLKWPIPTLDRVDENKVSSNIEIEMSLLPRDFRPNQGSGNTSENRERYINNNEGISILRNKREVFYGPIPYWPKQPPFKEIDRWWGCEIRFDAYLDRAFTVKNIKQGAVPDRELKKTLAERINPTRKTCLEKVRDDWQKMKQKEKENEANKTTSTGHEAAEKIAKYTSTPKNLIDKGKNTEEETISFVERWQQDAEEAQKAAWREKFSGQPFTIIDEDWRGPHFFDTYHTGGNSILSYNNRHTFFEELERIKDLISQEFDGTSAAEQLRDLIDILIMSYAKAEAMFDDEIELKAEDFAEQLKSAWGNYLKNYISTWHNNR